MSPENGCNEVIYMVETECRVFVVKRLSTRSFRPRRPRVCAPTAAAGGGEGGRATDGRAQARLTHHEDEGIPRRTRADRHGDVAVGLAPRQPVRPTADQRAHTAVVEAQSDQCAQPRYVLCCVTSHHQVCGWLP